MDDIQEVKIMDNYSSRSRKSHFKESFNFYIILYMDFISLNKIKLYIINNFVNKKLTKFIQPAYEKEKLLIVHIPEWQDFQKFKTKKRGTIDWSLYVAFLLGGEGFHVQKIRTTSVLDGVTWFMQKKYLAGESRWNQQNGKILKSMMVVLVELPAKGGILWIQMKTF